MNKHEIIHLLIKSHQSFITYIDALTDEDYNFSYEQKWTAGQQLEHILLCVQPLVRVFGMDAAMIERRFGRAKQPGRNYETLLTAYEERIKGGVKAPERFVPANNLQGQKEQLTAELAKSIQELSANIENHTEETLDSLCIPHPAMGDLTLREMLYNTIVHVEHHHALAEQNLKGK